MMKKTSLIYKLLILIVTGISLYINLKYLTFRKGIAYFTIQSNLFCFIFYLVSFILFIFKKLKKGDTYYLLKGMATMAITLTMVIYYFVIATHGITGYEGHNIECIFAHLIVPGLIMLDYVIFGEKGHLKKNYPFIWSLFLLIYTAFSNLYVMLGGTYINGKEFAYFFMDSSKYGTSGVMINSLILYVSFVVFGIIVYYLDNKASKQRKIV